MPLSKKRDRERKRQARLDAKISTATVQPVEVGDTIEDSVLPADIEYIDADGCPVYDV